MTHAAVHKEYLWANRKHLSVCDSIAWAMAYVNGIWSFIGLCGMVQALCHAVDLAPQHKHIAQELQESKSHLSLEQLAQVS